MTCTFTEPTLDDLLADPLVQLVMRADGLSRSLVRELMETARQTLLRATPLKLDAIKPNAIKPNERQP